MTASPEELEGWADSILLAAYDTTGHLSGTTERPTPETVKEAEALAARLKSAAQERARRMAAKEEAEHAAPEALELERV